MRTASPRRAPAATWRRHTAPAPLARAVRTVHRWGLLAGLTGFLANVLLVVLFTTPADGPYAWTGPANDTVGAVSALVMIPVAAGLLAVCGNRPGLGAITSLAIVAMVMIAASRAGRASGRLPRQVASCGIALGAAGLAGAALLAAPVPMPAHSPTHDITFGAGLLTGFPVALPGLANRPVLPAARPPG